jgi:hypothetical protein
MKRTGPVRTLADFVDHVPTNCGLIAATVVTMHEMAVMSLHRELGAMVVVVQWASQSAKCGCIPIVVWKEGNKFATQPGPQAIFSAPIFSFHCSHVTQIHTQGPRMMIRLAIRLSKFRLRSIGRLMEVLFRHNSTVTVKVVLDPKRWN